MGFLQELTLLAPANLTTTYLDYEDEFAHYELLDTSEMWAFAFHDACWRMLLLKLGDLSSSPLATDVVSRHLFDIFTLFRQINTRLLVMARSLLHLGEEGRNLSPRRDRSVLAYG